MWNRFIATILVLAMGEAIGFTEPLFPRRAGVGVLVEFRSRRRLS